MRSPISYNLKNTLMTPITSYSSFDQMKKYNHSHSFSKPELAYAKAYKSTLISEICQWF